MKTHPFENLPIGTRIRRIQEYQPIEIITTVTPYWRNNDLWVKGFCKYHGASRFIILNRDDSDYQIITPQIKLKIKQL